MAVTTTKTLDIRNAANNGNLNQSADIARAVKRGNMDSTVKVTCTALTAAATFDITSAAVKAKATIVGMTLDTNELLPPIGVPISLRVTAGGTAGQRTVSDAGATTSTSLATLSDDGKTLTFETSAAVTAFVLIYKPREAVALTTAFQQTAP